MKHADKVFISKSNLKLCNRARNNLRLLPIAIKQKIQTLESSNTDFQKIAEQQNQQITQLIQSSEQATHKIENLNLINTILIAVLVVVACTFLVVKFMNRKDAIK